MKLVVIDAFSHQKKFIESMVQFPLLVGGLGCGKTFSGVMRTIKLIYDNKNHKKTTGSTYNFGIYMPNYSYFRLQIIPQFELLLPKVGITDFIINKSEFTIKIGDYAVIIMKSLDNPASIISYEVHDSWVDELDTMKSNKASDSFDKIKQRNRAKKMAGLNTVCVTSTPDGGTLGFLYKQWIEETVKNPDLKKSYEVIRGETKNNIYLPADYLMSAFSGLTFDKYRQMGLGEFVDVSSLPVYTRYNRFLCNSDKMWNGEQLHIGMDFNVNKMSASVLIKDNENHFHVVDEIVVNSMTKENIKDTPEMIQEILHRYPKQKITIYPDASGNQRNSINSQTTNVSLLKEHFKVCLNYKTTQSKPTNPSIEESVQVVNQEFRNRLFVNSEMCPNLVKNLLSQQYVEKDGKFVPDKSKGDDHMIDSLRYVTYYLFKNRGGDSEIVSYENSII